MMLCSVDDVKQYLGVQVDTTDALIEAIIVGASSFIENYTNRNFDIQEFTEILDGTGSSRLPVGNAPITEVVSVVDVYSNTYSPKFQNNILFFSDGTVFASGKMNYTVTYKGGYATVPDDVKWACIVLSSYKFKDRERIGQLSKTIGGEVVSFQKIDMRDHIRSVLAPYVRVT